MNLLVGVIAFISEYLDSGLGMGYGTALSPILILLGYDAVSVIPAILISQLCTDIAACLSHNYCANVDLRPGTRDFKVALLLGIISSLGVIISVIIALRIPKRVLSLYVGLLVTLMGGLIIITRNKQMGFSWRPLTKGYPAADTALW